MDVLWASSLGTSSDSRFYRLPYLWGRSFKTLLFEEPPHPNRMASLAMENPIQLLNGLLGWDKGSKLSVVLDITCSGCSCNLPDCGQVLCRLLLCCFLLLLLTLLLLILLYRFAALFVGSSAMTNVIFAALFVGFCHPRCRVLGFIV